VLEFGIGRVFLGAGFCGALMALAVFPFPRFCLCFFVPFSCIPCTTGAGFFVCPSPVPFVLSG